MSIEKKSLISTLKTTKKANAVSAPETDKVTKTSRAQRVVRVARAQRVVRAARAQRVVRAAKRKRA